MQNTNMKLTYPTVNIMGVDVLVTKLTLAWAATVLNIDLISHNIQILAPKVLIQLKSIHKLYQEGVTVKMSGYAGSFLMGIHRHDLWFIPIKLTNI